MSKSLCFARKQHFDIRNPSKTMLFARGGRNDRVSTFLSGQGNALRRCNTESISKGDKVHVLGRLRASHYVDDTGNRQTKVTIKKTTYRNNSTLALILNELDGDECAVVTVNLNHPLQSDDMAFLDENNYPGIGKWIEKNLLGRQMGFVAASGFCRYPLYTLFIE